MAENQMKFKTNHMMNEETKIVLTAMRAQSVPIKCTG